MTDTELIYAAEQIAEILGYPGSYILWRSDFCAAALFPAEGTTFLTQARGNTIQVAVRRLIGNIAMLGYEND